MEAQSKAKIAEASDVQLWGSRASTDEYNVKRRVVKKMAEAERRDFMDQASYFPSFSRLPFDMRFYIWKMAILVQPTEVMIVAFRYKVAQYDINARCGTRGPPSIAEYRARATLPALFLVNHEANAVAKQFYSDAFRNTEGRYGVLAAFPTVLALRAVESQLLELLVANNSADLAIVETFLFTTPGYWRNTGDDVRFEEATLAMRNMRLLDIHIITPGIVSGQLSSKYQWAQALLVSLKKQFMDNQDRHPEWSVPKVRIVHPVDGDPTGNELEWYLYKGGQASDMPDNLAIEMPST
jgi:hypothetical protein